MCADDADAADGPDGDRLPDAKTHPDADAQQAANGDDQRARRRRLHARDLRLRQRQPLDTVREDKARVDTECDDGYSGGDRRVHSPASNFAPR